MNECLLEWVQRNGSTTTTTAAKKSERLRNIKEMNSVGVFVLRLDFGRSICDMIRLVLGGFRVNSVEPEKATKKPSNKKKPMISQKPRISFGIWWFKTQRKRNRSKKRTTGKLSEKWQIHFGRITIARRFCTFCWNKQHFFSPKDKFRRKNRTRIERWRMKKSVDANDEAECKERKVVVIPFD